MALSENEQRMLDEIENSLLAEEPRFRSAMGGNTSERTFALNPRSIAIMLVGLCMLIGGVALISSDASMGFIALSVAGFVVMFVGLLMSFTPDTSSGSASHSEETSQKQSSNRGDKIEDRFKKRFE